MKRRLVSLFAVMLLVIAFAISELNLYRIDVDRAAANHRLIKANAQVLKRVAANEIAQCVFEHHVYQRQILLDKTITTPVQLSEADQFRRGLTDSELKAANAALAGRNDALGRERHQLLSTLAVPLC